MELLLQVRGEDLIEYIETPEVTVVLENDISDLDLTDHYRKNSEIIEQIYTAYQGFNEQASEASEAVKESFEQTAGNHRDVAGELMTMEETMAALAIRPE